MNERPYRMRTNCSDCEKPTLGLRHRWVVAEERMSEIMDAIRRYSESKMVVPVEWLDEYNELAEYLKNRC